VATRVAIARVLALLERSARIPRPVRIRPSDESFRGEAIAADRKRRAANQRRRMPRRFSMPSSVPITARLRYLASREITRVSASLMKTVLSVMLGRLGTMP
jgi:hypothetical protein